MNVLIVSISYKSLAIPYSSPEQLGALIAALSVARAVDSQGYGDEQRYVPESNEAPEFKIVSGEKVTIGDEVATLKAQLAQKTEEANQRSQWWSQSNQKAAALEKELKALKEAQAQEVPL